MGYGQVFDMPSKVVNEATHELSGEDDISFSHVKAVAIIGGGASGAIALDSLVKEGIFDKIYLFERRERMGGIWCLDRGQIKTPNDIIKAGATSEIIDPPLPNPFNLSEETVNDQRLLLPRNRQERFLETPSYPEIKTNITEQLMTFSDETLWTGSHESDTRYVDGLVVRDYIERYIVRNENREDVEIVPNSTVEDVERLQAPKNEEKVGPHKYKITIRQRHNDHQDIWYQKSVDAIVVASGHYHVPFIPEVPGLSRLQSIFPDAVVHAKYFRDPDFYKNKVVVIVGSRASGADLTRLIGSRARCVYQSIRNFKGTKIFSKRPNVTVKSVIKQIEFFEDNQFAVIFDDNTRIFNPDHIVYGTGYQFSYPFLNLLFQTDNEVLTQEGMIVPNLYQHTFLINDPLITFVGIPIDGISFRVFEYQAVLVSRFLAGKVTLPSVKNQIIWRQNRLDKKGVGRSYHTIGLEDAFTYINDLVALGKLPLGTSITGREFPSFSLKDLNVYRESGEKLRALWDEQ